MCLSTYEFILWYIKWLNSSQSLKLNVTFVEYNIKKVYNVCEKERSYYRAYNFCTILLCDIKLALAKWHATCV